jgi:hypothetical protein
LGLVVDSESLLPCVLFINTSVSNLFSQHFHPTKQQQQGTRIHIYEFDSRVLRSREEVLAAANGEMLSIPKSNSRWTDKFQPGLDVFAAYRDDDDKLEMHVSAYLGPLIEFAKVVLMNKQDDWGRFPIYLKATGGLRTLQVVSKRYLQSVFI